MSADTTLTCRDCGQSFIFTAQEQDLYATRGYDHAPSRCPDCRAARKAERGAGADGVTSSGGGGYASTREAREMFTATCASCGKEAQVPFRPSGDKPVYCSTCYQERRGSAFGGRPRGRAHS
jgi:CxxC-x17-CxxC domain-containing protein